LTQCNHLCYTSHTVVSIETREVEGMERIHMAIALVGLLVQLVAGGLGLAATVVWALESPVHR
jgi:hypothetical protein